MNSPKKGVSLAAVILPLVALVVVLPTLAGLWGTFRTAFGFLPVSGFDQPGWEAWHRLVAMPGFWTSVRLTLTTGVVATILSLLLASGFAAWIWARWGLYSGGQWLTPILAAPHAALAIGLAFLIAPSGWLVRWVSPGLTGWEVPPTWATVNDPWGAALILGLVIKETAFLTLVLLTALAQLPVTRNLAAARALGWGPVAAWALVIWPQLYPMIRLPVLVVLSYSLSVVDVALILGPGAPPTLAVAMLRWVMSPDPGLLVPAAAAGLLLGMLIVGSILVWLAAEWGVRRLARRTVSFGPDWPGNKAVQGGVGAMGVILLLLMLGSGMVLALWSVAFRWSFPDPFPAQFTLLGWQHAAGWEAAGRTLVIGVTATVLALAMVLLWLEAEDRRARGPFWIEGILYIPLLIPQVVFLFGLQVVALRAGLSGSLWAVIWSHVFFIVPYMMIALAGPWRQLDPALIRASAALGAGPWRRWWRVKLPVLLRPVLVAAALGFSVSVALYVPTILLGAGRVTTLTTEAVALASGADRRITAVHALLQMALPLAAFLLAWWIPALLHRNRRGLRGGGLA